MAHFSLSWDAHKNNICTGLSALQQNGELVDMTLAADGHHVKVHQLVLSLASPYVKDIIASTQCQHPVIFLNKISYATLCALLEYIYTGEVLIAQENLDELIAAGKELHIKGLQDMKVDITGKSGVDESQIAGYNEGHQLTTSNHKEPVQTPTSKPKMVTRQQNSQAEQLQDIESHYLSDNVNDDTDDVMETNENSTTEDVTSLPVNPTTENVTSLSVNSTKENVISSSVSKDESRVQYTLSNQGSVQLVLNRFMYRISYTSTRDRRLKRWRCIESRPLHCRAVVFTKDELVIKRRYAHNHPFHDRMILKKIRNNAIFSAIVEAETALRKEYPRLKKDKSNK